MAKREAFLASGDVGSSLDAVQALIKKHEDFEKSLQAQVRKSFSCNPFPSPILHSIENNRNVVITFLNFHSHSTGGEDSCLARFCRSANS